MIAPLKLLARFILSIFIYTAFTTSLFSQTDVKEYYELAKEFQTQKIKDSADIYLNEAILIINKEKKDTVLTKLDSIQTDGFGSVENYLAQTYYNIWRNSKNNTDLIETNNYFTKSYLSLPITKRYLFSFTLTQLFVHNNEPNRLVYEWFSHAIYDFDLQSSETFNKYTLSQKLETKHSAILELTTIYSRKFGNCTEALEILREYKTDFYFKYVQPEGEKKHKKLWDEMSNEDNYLSWKCQENYRKSVLEKNVKN